uniref:Major facilitator superfamily (MFS) profile domain-containing protein n=1 Tax=Dendroctonus ponderosae TaxID=77166 RepID=A0AAR5P385_DENPD
MNLLYALFVLDILNIAIALPVFSAFVRSVGGSPFTLGLINSSGALVSLLWNPIVGSLSDQVGRKGLLLKCLIASSVGSVILAASTSVWLVFVGKLVGSLGSPVGILLRSIVADTYRTSEEKKAFFGKNGFFISVGFLVGSVSSGFLSEAKNGFAMSFLMMAAVTGISAALTYYALTPDAKKPKGKKQTDQSLLRKGALELKRVAVDIKSISWPRYKNLFIIKAGYDLSLTVFTANVGLIMLNEFNIQGRYMGYFLLMVSLLSIAINLLKMKLKNVFDNIPDLQLVISGCLMLMVSFVGLSISTNASMFFVFMVVLCVPRFILDVKLPEMITIQTRDDDRGKVLAAFENVMPLASFLVPAVSELIAEQYGKRIVLISATIPIAVSILVAYTEKSKRQ